MPRAFAVSSIARSSLSSRETLDRAAEQTNRRDGIEPQAWKRGIEPPDRGLALR